MLSPLPACSTIGILGGGQLGRMLALAGGELGFDVCIYEPEPDCPAGRVAAQVWTAAWDDSAALADFAKSVDVVTFEFENVPAESLAQIAAITPIRPGVRSLELTQDRLVEKEFVTTLGLMTAPFAAVNGADNLRAAHDRLGPQGIIKTRRFGYDGKGQMRITGPDDVKMACEALAQQDWIYEGFVDFACEVSVILARDAQGAMAAYDVTRNVHRAGILHTSSVPADLAPDLCAKALEHAQRIGAALDHIGVLAVEFFVTRDGALIVNEIAPRVHNSGHWTQDGCAVSQFQQHMRAVAGWPLGETGRLVARAEMTNLIGDDVAAWQSLIGQPNALLHLYGKRDARAGRKMGHVNCVTPWADGHNAGG